MKNNQLHKYFHNQLLMYNQFQIFNLINSIIHYMCPKKRQFAKMCTMIQKMSHFDMHSPYWKPYENMKKEKKIDDHHWDCLAMQNPSFDIMHL